MAYYKWNPKTKSYDQYSSYKAATKSGKKKVYEIDDESNFSNYVDLTDTALDDLTVSQQDDLVKRMMTTTINGIEAMPYQFLPSVDARLDKTGRVTSESKVGRKYAEKIMGRLPLLFLTPCFPQALADFSKEDKKRAITILTDKNNSDQNLISDLINGQGRYYNVRFAYDEYYRYLNCMLAAVAAYLGIHNEIIPTITGKKATIGNYDWSNELNPDFATFFNAKENVIFYIDNFNSISESFSNDTTTSSIADQINSTSDTAKELSFLLAGSNEALGKIADNVTDAVSSVSSAITSLLGTGDSIVGSIAKDGINTLANGGKIIFPEIWSNSDYSREYSLDIKLRSPDHDSISIFLNILKPYCKILCLCLPRIMDSEDHYDANGYMSPFLVKAFSKGKFNIDMGIISSLSVNKGAECQWNDDGLPTQIDISINIKDLYSSLAMSGFEDTSSTWNLGLGSPFEATKQIWKIVNNTAYMDFLANMAGLNVGTMDIGRRVKMYRYLIETAITQYPSRKFTHFEQSISRWMNNLYDIF